jgi:hypothetical protein
MSACAAKTRSGEPCKRAAAANGRCNLHGGKTPVGLALPQTKHGRYSKHLPTRLQARYYEAQSDTALLELREDIALIDARLADVLARVDTGESGSLWEALVEAKEYYHKAPARDKAMALYALLDKIDAGAADYAAWQDVRALLDQRRRTVESERKRLVEMQQTLTVERAMLLVGAVAGIVKAHVTDSKQLAAISADLGALLDRPAPIDVGAQ